MSTIINLYAGPGAGKSTNAAILFGLMKQAGLNVELIREYVKDWAWEGRNINKYDQLYFLGKHIRKESMLFDKVDYIITDSPVHLCAFYSDKYAGETITAGVLAAIRRYREQLAKDGHQIVEVWVDRNKPYNPAGRYQSEDEARQFDAEIRRFLLGDGVSPVSMSMPEVLALIQGECPMCFALHPCDCI